MEGESNNDMKRLRTQARKLDITIRAQRASGPSQPRAYRLIDRGTGREIQANRTGRAQARGCGGSPATDIALRVDRFRLIPKRARRAVPRGSGHFAGGTPRGYDYEASLKSSPHQSTWVDAHDLFCKGRDMGPHPRPDVAGRRTRVVERGSCIWRTVRSIPWRELAIAAMVGVVIGVIVTVAASTR